MENITNYDYHNNFTSLAISIKGKTNLKIIFFKVCEVYQIYRKFTGNISFLSPIKCMRNVRKNHTLLLYSSC